MAACGSKIAILFKLLITEHSDLHCFRAHPQHWTLSAVWDEVKFIDCDAHCYTCTVKEAIHVRLHPNNINRDSGIEIPEVRMPTIKKYKNRKASKNLTAERTTHRNSED